MARTAVIIAVLLLTGLAHAELIWWDGTHDPADAPPGKLLSDNAGYWGDCVLTGVEYHYETEPDNPRDIYRDDAKRFGRRLLDGRADGSWWVPVGQNPGKPLVVVFDFKRQCTFSEVDLSTRSKKIAVQLECGDAAGGPWRKVYERSREACPEKMFHRLPLPEHPQGRYLRLTADAGGITWLEEVLAWGDAEVSANAPEEYQPVTPTPVVQGVAFASIPGIPKTTFADAQFWEWQRQIGPATKQAAVWAQVPTWDSITDKPLLPAANMVDKPVALVVARNETECAALALTNTSMEKPAALTVSLSAFRQVGGGGATTAKVTGKLRVAGAIGSRYYGTNLGPLFEVGNMPGASLMQRYLTHGPGVKDFPKVTLSPAGSCVIWLSVTTQGAAPGVYEATLNADGAQPLVVRAEVLNVTLPAPPVWVQTYSGTTGMFPFTYGDRLEREVAFKASLGVTVWDGFPTPGSASALARKHGRAIYHVMGLPDEYVNKGYNGQIKAADLGPKEEKAVADHIAGLVAQARALGLTYDDWFVELWDEPGRSTAPTLGAFARLIRKADPKVRIYCNPSFWEGSGCVDDAAAYPPLESWYRECVDISVPIMLLLRDRPKCWTLFDAKRSVRASYNVCSQSGKSEQASNTELYRRFAWDTFARGWNGWGFYSYFAPRGDPWNDFDAEWTTGEDLPDYQVVYPGPRGPIATRQSEALRAGWEDYCLLTLLREKHLDQALAAILKGYADGEAMSALRVRALRAAAQGH